MKKPYKTLQERIVFTINYIKNFMFIIVPLGMMITYVSVLVIKDTETYKRIDTVVNWYEAKSKSFAVGLRVNKEEKDGKIIYKVVYKATDGETYKAVYDEKVGAYFYLDEGGLLKECH